MNQTELFYIAVAPLCLVAYDTVLTFPREAECIWRRRLGPVSVIFTSQRWVLVLDGVVNLSRPTRLSAHNSVIQMCAEQLPRCKAQLISDHVFAVLGMLGTAAFSTLRIWAIWDNAVIPTAAVFFTSMFLPAVNIYAYSAARSFTIVNGICLENNALTPTLSAQTQATISAMAHAARSAAVVSDLLVLALTWVKTAGIWRESLNIRGFKPTFTVLLLRDGSVYFGMLLLLNVVALLLDSIQTNFDGSTAFIAIVNAVTANLVARFILDLRSISVSAEGSGPMSSIRFDIGSLAGNLDAVVDAEVSGLVDAPIDTGGKQRQDADGSTDPNNDRQRV
ncbi:hypothetical protein EIP91_002808 [Steccherinum ochraceum]|uniref:DUF6533 domain-containing protein n=1 Tax=Steccherinum ochraceum TaxID=92696 RepID=A0A4R0RD85_9APHY|nr:hypothetical protein EIP91_002808 [Steccherinum ochraceum]